MKTTKLFKRLAQLANQHSNCITSNNVEWQDRTEEELTRLVKEYMPSGSGLDSGVKLDFDATMKCGASKLYFTTAFHHMDENGCYEGWTEHVVTVSPSLASGFTLSISGRNRNDIKSYLHELFESCLNDEAWSLREAYKLAVANDPVIKINGRWKDACSQVFEIGLVNIEFGSFDAAVQWLNENGRLDH